MGRVLQGPLLGGYLNPAERGREGKMVRCNEEKETNHYHGFLCDRRIAVISQYIFNFSSSPSYIVHGPSVVRA